MIQLDPNQIARLEDWFTPDQACWMVGWHVLRTGNGTCFANRWPDPGAILADTAGNWTLMGDPGALRPQDLAGRVSGFVDAPERFVPLLEKAFPGLKIWQRVIYEMRARPRVEQPSDCLVRRLVSTDGHYLWGLSPESSWISKTWGGPDGLASSGYAWGAFVDGQLVSVACTFFLGERYEELGVVTEPAFRGQGLSAACAGGLCQDIQDRGRKPSWSTSPDNLASIRVAENLGFSFLRSDRLYVIGVPVPEAPGRG